MSGWWQDDRMEERKQAHLLGSRRGREGGRGEGGREGGKKREIRCSYERTTSTKEFLLVKTLVT